MVEGSRYAVRSVKGSSLGEKVSLKGHALQAALEWNLPRTVRRPA